LMPMTVWNHLWQSYIHKDEQACVPSSGGAQ
jgi:hypothetical protein